MGMLFFLLNQPIWPNFLATCSCRVVTPNGGLVIKGIPPERAINSGLGRDLRRTKRLLIKQWSIDKPVRHWLIFKGAFVSALHDRIVFHWLNHVFLINNNVIWMVLWISRPALGPWIIGNHTGSHTQTVSILCTVSIRSKYSARPRRGFGRSASLRGSLL